MTAQLLDLLTPATRQQAALDWLRAAVRVGQGDNADQNPGHDLLAHLLTVAAILDTGKQLRNQTGAHRIHPSKILFSIAG